MDADRGPRALPIADVLELGARIAEALAETHRTSDAQRAVGPTHGRAAAEGDAEVLDFGLAEILRRQELDRPSGWKPRARGALSGTVLSMSPEQAAGREVDRRASLFALGVVLFELTTGRRPFAADSTEATRQRILALDPGPLAAARRDVPAELERIVAKCLEKEPAWRYQNAGALAHDLKALRRALDSGARLAASASAARPVLRRRRLSVALTIAALALVALGAVVVVGRARRTPSPTPPLRFQQLTFEPGLEELPTLSPDGQLIVYTARDDLWLLRVGGERAVNLTPDSPAEDTQPAFSPDGNRIAFRSERDGGGIFVMGATGESVRRLTDFGFTPAWSPDGRTLAITTDAPRWTSTRFSSTSELWLVDVASGERRRLEVADALDPSFSPDGRRIAFAATRNGRRDLWTVPVAGGPAVALTDDAPIDGSPAWSPAGELTFASDRNGSMNLWTLRVDPRSGEALGPPQPFLQPGSFVASFSWSRDGRRMAFTNNEASSNLWAIDLDPATGSAVGEGRWLTRGSNLYAAPSISPDGSRIGIHAQIGPWEDLVLFELDGSGFRRLTEDAHRDRRPVWMPDGERIAFYSDRGGKYEIWSLRPDGSAPRLELALDQAIVYPRFSPDGRTMSFNWQGDHALLVDLRPGARPVELPRLPEPGSWFQGFDWSPDGKRLAGWRGFADRRDTGIVVYSLADGSFRRFNASGRFPAWLSDGRRLLYAHDGELRLLDSASGAERVLIDVSPDTLYTCDPTPDDRMAVCDRRESESAIWLLRRD